ncbi:phosphatidate phosphatase PAH2 isoform X4 [Alnus glutinosa]|uniref:phosphatidate phosphatase PAH2 isoform X4 n=1 Tax=Alnus glutinosa TaxID=3517 RepID=UPI002D799DE5|nr:phosphatidate phosphatase PAH2 isoform X4 [Alnus glutinosa]
MSPPTMHDFSRKAPKLSLSLEIAIDETIGQWPFYLEPVFLLPRGSCCFNLIKITYLWGQSDGLLEILCDWIVRFYYLAGLKMYAVERLSSYITRGVYTVSGPFHPFGGAVDIIVVEQQDGSFKSSPWYVRFGKFQGVLKAKERVVNICVNGVEAGFHMNLDHKGEAYFLREVDVEEGEIVPYSVSSGDETEGRFQNDRRSLKSKSYNFDANTSNSADKIDLLRNGKALARTTSRRPRILGLVFGRRRSMKEEGYQEGEGDDGVARADSLERAEIAANLLEVKWSTNLYKSRKGANKDVQITDGKGEVSSSEHGNVKNSLDQYVLHEQTGSHNEQMGESSLSGFENLQSFVEETRIEVACFSTPEQVTETSVAGESVLEGKCELMSTLSRKIDVGDTENDENTKVQDSIEHEGHPGKHIDEEQVFHVTNVLPGCGISQEESETDRVRSFIYCETSERSIVAMDVTSEQTRETMYLGSGELGEVHVHTEMLHSTTELLSEDTVTLQVAEDGDFQTDPVEDPVNHSQEMNPSRSFIHKCNVMDLEGPSIEPEVDTQMVSVGPTLGLDDKVVSQSICTISGFSNSAHQAQDKENNKDEEITSKFQPSLESIGDCVPIKAISTLSLGSSEEEQFLFSDLDEISEVQRMESIYPVHVDKESPSSSPEDIKEANRLVNERYDPSLLSEKSAQENPFIDLEGSIEKLRISSSPIIIPRSHKVSGEEVGRLVESLPNLWSHTVSPDAHDFCRPLSQSLDSSSKSLNSKLQSNDDSSYIKSDKDPQLALEQPNIEDTQITVEPINGLANSAVEISLCKHLLYEGMGADAASQAFDAEKLDVNRFTSLGPEVMKDDRLVVKIYGLYFPWDVAGPIVLGMVSFGSEQIFEPTGMIAVDKVEKSLTGDPSKSSVASRGGWRIWPFSFRKSRSKKGLQPVLKDVRNSDVENASESTMGMGEDKNVLKPKVVRKIVREMTPTSEQLASMNLKEGRNTVTFTFSTAMLGKQQVDARIYLWKWNTRIVISDVDGTITKSDVLGQFMPFVGVDWSQTGVAHLFSAIKENGYQLLFLSARAISQAYHTRQFLFNLKQDGKALPDGPVVISPDGLFPSLYREGNWCNQEGSS